jgi:hypothetical protein
MQFDSFHISKNISWRVKYSKNIDLEEERRNELSKQIVEDLKKMQS